jgi:hypothetical protein
MIALTLYHLIYVLFIYNFSITKEIFLEFPYLFALFLVSLGFAMLFTWCKCKKIQFIVIPSVITVLLYVFIYYFYILSHKEKDLPFYFNPMSFVGLASGLPFLVFVGSFFVRYCSLVMKGLTTKQFDSIRKNKIISKDFNRDFVIDDKGNENTNITEMVKRSGMNLNQLNFLKKLANVYYFLTKKRPASLINDYHIA